MQRIIRLFPLVAALWFSAPAAAQWYAGASAGSVEAKVHEGGGAQSAGALGALGFANAQTRVDKRDTGYRLFGGYRLTRHFAVELGYADLGKHQIDSNVTVGSATPGLLTHNITVDGFDVSVVGEVPLRGNWSAYGRVGAFTAEAKSSVMASGAIALFNADGTRREKRSTQVAYALGLNYALSPKVALRGEWSRFDGIRSFDVLGTGGKTDVDLYTVGVTYRFF
jgi:OOP family OmpA-OmpF porin